MTLISRFSRLRKFLRNRLLIWLEKSLLSCPELSIFHEFPSTLGGGGNQFLQALRKEFLRRGISVCHNVASEKSLAILFNSFNFEMDRLKRSLGAKSVVHRVDGPIEAYRGFDDGTDRKVWNLNRLFAQRTVFQSQYSLEKYYQNGFSFKRPVVIMNSSDPDFFHRYGKAPFCPGRRIRLISTSWSDNKNKGWEIFEWLDKNLDWERFEYTFVGRVSGSFRRIQVIPPVPSQELGEILRSHDLFIAASKNDPCSNSLIEALSCGLPAVALNSGGHPEIIGSGGILFDFPEEIPVALQEIENAYFVFQSRIRVPSVSEVADKYLSVMGLKKVGHSYVPFP